MDIIFCGLYLINQEPADQQKKLPGRYCSGNIVVQIIYPWVGIRNITYRAFFKSFASCIQMRSTVNVKITIEINPSIRI